VAVRQWLSGYGVAGKAVYVADTKYKITADGYARDASLAQRGVRAGVPLEAEPAADLP
jgi:hypothetical protein